MAEIIGIEALSRTQERVVYDDSREAIRCYSFQNPHYYQDEAGKLRPINLSQVDEVTVTIGDSFIRRKNVASVGIRKDNNPYKYLGIRPDNTQALGTEQLEYTIEQVEFDEKPQAVDLSQNKILSPTAIDLGGVVIRSTRQSTQQLFKANNKIKSFRIRLTLHLKGLTVEHKKDIDEFWFYGLDGGFRFRIRQPLLVDTVSRWPIEDNQGRYLQGQVKHSLTDNGDGTYTYTKESGSEFGATALPENYLIDSDTAYSSTADGYVTVTDADWDTARNAETGDDRGYGDHNVGLAFCGSLMGNYMIFRSFFYFDTSGITGTVTDVIANIYGSSTSGSPEVCLQEGTQSATLAHADYDAFSGSYFGKLATWTTSGYNEITFDSAGKTYVENNLDGECKICGREYTHDYADSAPAGTNWRGCWFADEEGTTKDPYLEITVSSGGQTHEATCTDGLSIGDSPSRSVIIPVSCTDGLSIGEIPVRSADLPLTVSDGMTLGEVLAGFISVNLEAFDGLNMGDSPGRSVIIPVSCSDGLSIGEIPVRSADLPVAASDGLTLGEILAGIITINLEASDGLSLGDQAGSQTTYHIEVSDGIQMAEVINALISFAITITDGFTLGDLGVYAFVGAKSGVRLTLTVKGRVFHFVVEAKAFHFEAADRSYFHTTKH